MRFPGSVKISLATVCFLVLLLHTVPARAYDLKTLAARLADGLLAEGVFPRGLPTLLVASFLEEEDFAGSSPLGRLLAELLAEELHRRGFTVYEARLTRDLVVFSEGERVLSRRASELYREIAAHAVVSGIIARTERGLLIQARMVSLADSRLLSVTSLEVLSDVMESGPTVYDRLP